jgi:hypothetical protein
MIPERFSATVAAVEAVCAELDSPGDFRPFGQGRWIRDVESAWAGPIRHVAFVLDLEHALLAIYVILQLPAAGAYPEGLAVAVTRANYGLLPGCFELDLESGATRYRTVLGPLPEDIETQPVAQMLSSALQISQKYSPAFSSVIETNADPIDAVDEIESQE